MSHGSSSYQDLLESYAQGEIYFRNQSIAVTAGAGVNFGCIWWSLLEFEPLNTHVFEPLFEALVLNCCISTAELEAISPEENRDIF